MELTQEEALQKAVEAHKAGQIQEADRLYTAILQAQPKHPDANHNMGVLAAGVGKVQEALPFFKSALDANPRIEQFWLSYIDVLIKDKQFNNAKAVLEQGRKGGLVGDKVDALESQLKHITQSKLPKLSEEKKNLTLKEKLKKIAESKQQKKQAKDKNANNLSPTQSQVDNLLAHYQNGRYYEAEKLAVTITQKFPKYQFGWKVLSASLKQTGRVHESLAPSQKATALSPQDTEAHNNLGNTLKKLGRLDEAEASYKLALALKPDLAEAHSNLGFTLQELGRLEESEASLRQAIALKPDYLEAHNNLGNTLQELGRLDDAEASLRQAILLKPDYFKAHNNLGNTLKELGRLDEAEASYIQAIALKPDYAEAHNNLGLTLQEMGRLDEAKVNFKQAIALKPEFVEAILNLSNTLSYMDALGAEILILQNLLQSDFNSEDDRLKAGVSLAICNFLNGKFTESKKHLLAATKLQEKASSDFTGLKVYQSYLLSLFEWYKSNNFDGYNEKIDTTLYIIGESHSLVSHYLRVKHLGSHFFGKAKLIKGCKQWHLGNSVRNQYKCKFESIFGSIPKSSKVLLTFGEIDCRLDSGIIKHKKKFPEKYIDEIISATVENYLSFVLKNNSNYQHNVVIQGVPCPNIDTEDLPEEKITQLIEVIKTFNCELKNKSKKKGFGFLDVHKLTDRGDGFSNSVWHIDSNHLSPDGMLEAWHRYNC